MEWFFLLLFGGIISSSIIKKNSLDSSVTATYIEWKEHYDNDDNSITYSPIYHYEVDDKEFICDSNVSSNIKSGDGTVYYDSNNPSKCMTDFEDNSTWIFLIFLLIPLIFVVIGAVFIKSYLKKSKSLKPLASNGILVKGIPYQIIDSNVTVNNRGLKCFSITFTFPNGSTKNIVSEPANDHILYDHDGKCDLLYEPDDYSNYYIDKNIQTTGKGNPIVIYYQ